MGAYIYGAPTRVGNIPLCTLAVLETLLGLAQNKGKRYCWPSQKTILKLCETYHGIKMCRSTLNRKLTWLENHKYFTRTRRHRKSKEITGFGKDGHFRPCSTLYQFSAKAFNYLRQRGKDVFKFFSHFRLPQWEIQKIKEGKSALLRSIRSCLASQKLPDGCVKTALRL